MADGIVEGPHGLRGQGVAWDGLGDAGQAGDGVADEGDGEECDRGIEERPGAARRQAANPFQDEGQSPDGAEGEEGVPAPGELELAKHG